MFLRKLCSTALAAGVVIAALAGCNTKSDKGSTRNQNPSTPPGTPKEVAGPQGSAVPTQKAAK